MKITDALLKEIYAHAQQTYPGECFGFLVGAFDDGGRVRRIVPGTNLNTQRNDRFEMDPSEFMQGARAAEASGYEIIGFYHSHPDFPPIPSQTDLLSEVEGSYYMIVSIHRGHPLNTGVWRIAPAAPRRFVPLPLEVVDEREPADD
ncbi:MAG: Mov34/MPN/PAD-1 family protein [Anaerolineae bacterium]